MQEKLTRYLVRRASAEVFIWNEILAKRKDLEEVFAENVQAALKKDSMPDPRQMSLAQLEGMKKEDILIFAKVKLGLSLDAANSKAILIDQVKEEIFTRPTEDEAAMSVPATDQMDRPRARAN